MTRTGIFGTFSRSVVQTGKNWKTIKRSKRQILLDPVVTISGMVKMTWLCEKKNNFLIIIIT